MERSKFLPMAKRNAAGSGSIKHRKDGRWEAKYSYTDKLGQPKRSSVYGRTQKECRQKLTQILKNVDEGSYRETEKRYTVKEWFEEWLTTYCKTLKPRTMNDYRSRSERYIIPHLGKAQLSALTPMQVQRFINLLSDGDKNQKPLSPKTVQNIHGILHSALKQAVLSGVITQNPADNTKLPKAKRPELKPLMDDSITDFLEVIKGDPYERVFIVDLFTGMRQSEILGLQWQDVNFAKQEIRICRQLQKDRTGKGYLFIDETKNGKDRVIPIPPTVAAVLKAQQREQKQWQLAAGPAWRNEHNLVFTNELGDHLRHSTVYQHFKKLVKKIGMDETRFHDLRHSTAILELQNGCSVKAVQQQLGHYSSSFTMDTYAAVSETMRQDTRNRLEQYIQQVSNL